jgi:hypothetical protein
LIRLFYFSSFEYVIFAIINFKKFDNRGNFLHYSTNIIISFPIITYLSTLSAVMDDNIN